MVRARRRLAALLLVATFVVACTDRTPPVVAAPSATVTPTANPNATPTPLSTTSIDALLRRAVCWYEDPALARKCVPVGPDVLTSIDVIGRSSDRRLIAPLVDMLNVDVGWNGAVEPALERLTGDHVEGADRARAWREWLTAHAPMPTPPGYAEWKARLLALTSSVGTQPPYTQLLTDKLGAALPLLHWTQVQPNASRPLSTPRAVAGRAATWLDPNEVVYGVAVAGEARAYPQRIVAWHGAVNDVVGGQPVLLSYCLPCGGAAAFDRRTSTVTLEFGTSGLSLQSRSLLLDRQTPRLWDALTGAAIGEPRAALAAVPMFTTTWADWFARHPATTVLDVTTGVIRDYAPGAANRDVLDAPGPLYPVTPVDARLEPKPMVLGVSAGGQQRAYPVADVTAKRIIQERIGTQDVVIVCEGDGKAIGAYEATGSTFVRIIDSGVDLVLADSDGNRWAMRESALINERSRKTLPALDTRETYWFAWASAYPGTSVYGKP